MGKKSSVTIQELPCEILENIFVFLDGWSLARAQCVCKLWKQVINNLQSCKDVWEQCCQLEIGEDLLIDIETGQNYSQFRKDLYKQWFATRHVGKWPVVRKYFPTFDENPVSCVKLAGSIVVTGHRNGYISWWNTDSGVLQGVVWVHHQLVTDIIILILQIQGKARTVIVSSSLDQTIQVTTVNENSKEGSKTVCLTYHCDSVTSLSGFQNRFAARSDDHTISIWNISPSDKDDLNMVNVELETVVNRQLELISWMGFWKNELLCLGKNCSFGSYSLMRKSWCPSWTPEVEVLSTDLDEVEMNIFEAFVFRQSVVVILSTDKIMFISVDGRKFRRYTPFSIIHAIVLSVCVKGNLLALGTEKGHGFVYHFNRDEDLLNLDLSKPDWTGKLSEGSIIGVDIGSDGFHPLVAMTTTDAVYVMKWATSVSQPPIAQVQ